MQWKDHLSLRRAWVGGAVAVALLTATIWTSLEPRTRPAVRVETPNGSIVEEQCSGKII